MRLWSLHPRYLDVKGLTALWREGLLAQKVLQGKTIGYRRHPQLARFQNHPSPRAALAGYLRVVWQEARRRGYAFDRGKIGKVRKTRPLTVTRGQLRFEWRHLRAKLRRRDPARFQAMGKGLPAHPHPSFRVVPGGLEAWEKGAGLPAPGPRRRTGR